MPRARWSCSTRRNSICRRPWTGRSACCRATRGLLPDGRVGHAHRSRPPRARSRRGARSRDRADRAARSAPTRCCCSPPTTHSICACAAARSAADCSTDSRRPRRSRPRDRCASRSAADGQRPHRRRGAGGGAGTGRRARARLHGQHRPVPRDDGRLRMGAVAAAGAPGRDSNEREPATPRVFSSALTGSPFCGSPFPDSSAILRTHRPTSFSRSTHGRRTGVQYIARSPDPLS